MNVIQYAMKAVNQKFTAFLFLVASLKNVVAWIEGLNAFMTSELASGMGLF